MGIAAFTGTQERPRLIILAAAPGRALPPFPLHTHAGLDFARNQRSHTYAYMFVVSDMCDAIGSR